jgi:hypothetical protein
MQNNLPIKNKMAVVFHGIVGGMNSHNGVGPPTNISDCAKTIKYNVLSTYDCDIFCHSWSVDHKEEIISLYNPVMSLFQPQEYFGYSGIRASEDPLAGQAFRGTSKYVSLQRGMMLKQQYEKENNFRYKWVFVIRYDLVFFTKLDLSTFDNNMIYPCTEPHWGHNTTIIDDRLFLSNSNIMDALSNMGSEAIARVYNLSDVHAAIGQKIRNVLGGNLNLIGFRFDRYKDVEVYRVIIKPELNPVGHAYGALDTKSRLENLLKSIPL